MLNASISRHICLSFLGFATENPIYSSRTHGTALDTVARAYHDRHIYIHIYTYIYTYIYIYIFLPWPCRIICYLPFLNTWDSKWSLEFKLESRMVNDDVPFEMSRLKRDMWWPSSTPISTPISILGLIFSGTGCTLCRIRWLKIIMDTDEHSVAIYNSHFRKRDLQTKPTMCAVIFWPPLRCSACVSPLSLWRRLLDNPTVIGQFCKRDLPKRPIVFTIADSHCSRIPGRRNHVFDPASVFLSTHSWSQHPTCQRCFINN